MSLTQKLSETVFVAFDTETSGAYPIGNEIVEFGAVKWRGDEILGSMQFLLKPREPMSDFIIGIHGITNEMVENSDVMPNRIREIDDFMQGAVVVAHHAPFDLGFLAYEFEKAHLPLARPPALCTSLMSRALIGETANHKLQTLVQHFGWDGGTAHRALDDAKACMFAAKECFKRLGPEATLENAYAVQGKKLDWPSYSVLALNSNDMKTLIQGILEKKTVEFQYAGGSKKGESRQVRPWGIVRNPDGDYLQAFCLIDQIAKRYYLSRISDVQLSLV